MPDSVLLEIHDSQWPETQHRQLIDALRQCRIPPKFHYQSPRQVRCWLRLHELFSPARASASCQAAYHAALEAAASQVATGGIEVLALGCGGGQKEVALLEALVRRGARPRLTACDVGVGLVITTMQRAWSVLSAECCRGLVCDLTKGNALDRVRWREGPTRVVTLFGMIPNFTPQEVRTVLDRVLRPGDLLVCSANLAPGPDYESGVVSVLPQYDNQPTRQWLEVWLGDLGITAEDGVWRFSVESCPQIEGLLRIVGGFELKREVTAWVEHTPVKFRGDERLEVFFSYRHTAETLRTLLDGLGLEGTGQWVAAEVGEGIFLFRRG